MVACGLGAQVGSWSGDWTGSLQVQVSEEKQLEYEVSA